jgi:hypothetical protein
VAVILVVTAALAALPAQGDDSGSGPEIYQAPPSTGSLDFHWDALVRYDAIQLNRQAPSAKNIYRWRSEVRPELDWRASDRFRLGVRLLGELSSDSNATNDKRFDNYRSNDARVDRFFVEARPGNFTLLGGQFGMPFRTTEMLWDRDVQVLGGFASWRAPFSASASATFAAGYFYGPQREHDQSHIAAGQATLSLGSANGIEVDWSESYWRMTHLQNTGAHFLRQNVPAGYSSIPRYANDFRILDSLVRVRIPLGTIPVVFSADWTHNFAAPESKYRDGIEAAIRIGNEGSPGDIQVFDVYQYVDWDAVLGAYNTDDWWFHSWYVGHRGGISITILPQVMVRPSVVFQRRQDRTHYLRRYLLDLVKTF